MAVSKAVQNPFVSGSVIAQIWSMCVKGTDRKAIEAVANKAKLKSIPRLFHCMRRGAYGDVTWTYNQDGEGNIEFSNVRGKAAKVVKKPVASAKAKAKTTRKVQTPVAA